MPDEQVLKHGVDALVFLVVQFRIFVKGHVFGSANSLHFAEHLDSFAFQGVEFCAHTFRPAAGHSTVRGSAAQEYFRTPFSIDIHGW
jgi:hypothetical protein